MPVVCVLMVIICRTCVTAWRPRRFVEHLRVHRSDRQLRCSSDVWLCRKIFASLLSCGVASGWTCGVFFFSRFSWPQRFFFLSVGSDDQVGRRWLVGMGGPRIPVARWCCSFVDFAVSRSVGRGRWSGSVGDSVDSVFFKSDCRRHDARQASHP